MGRKRKGTGNYFTEETQNAILKYRDLTSQYEKDALYSNYIHKPFLKIAEVWYNKIDTPYIDEEPSDAQMDCVIFMYQQLDKFKQDKGKAFSYFSIIARNYYIQKNNRAYVAYKKTNLERITEEFEVEDKSPEIAEFNGMYQNMYIDFIQYLKDNHKKLFRLNTQQYIGDELIRFLEEEIDNIEYFGQRTVRAKMFEKIEGKLTRTKLTKALNDLSVVYFDFRDAYFKEEEITSYKKKRLSEEDKNFIRKSFIPHDRKFGVIGLAKQVRVTEFDVRNFLLSENIL